MTGGSHFTEGHGPLLALTVISQWSGQKGVGQASGMAAVNGPRAVSLCQMTVSVNQHVLNQVSTGIS